MTPQASVPASRSRRSTQTLPRPRRVSGPLRPNQPTRSNRGNSLAGRAGDFVSSLPDRPLLDRIIRGRAWIPLLGVLLAGIVAMQVEVLKLGATIGREIQRSAVLQTRNDTLRLTVASLADDQRIERMAAAMGMVMPAPEAIGFLSSHPGADAGRAVANIHAPNPTGFLSLLYSNGAVVGAGGSSAPAPTALGTSTAASSPSAVPAPSPQLTSPAVATAATPTPSGSPSSTTSSPSAASGAQNGVATAPTGGVGAGVSTRTAGG